MTKDQLKPSSKSLVYDLVRDAGISVADWANYAGTNPASNPRYCYEWAFWDQNSRVAVVCVWWSAIHEEGATLSMELCPRQIAATSPHLDPSAGARKKRAVKMDRVLQYATRDQVPLRVVIVDGPRRGDGDFDHSSVQCRMLDPVVWRISGYDLASGLCRLVRDSQDAPSPSVGAEPAMVGARLRKLARIAYNTDGWRKPTHSAGEAEADSTFNAKHRFGHEEWLFRKEWQVDGWRYGFIQGLYQAYDRFPTNPLDVTLFTLEPETRRRRLVATIRGVECLSLECAQKAFEVFQREGWLSQMQSEVAALGGSHDLLAPTIDPAQVLNVRFRWGAVEFHPVDSYLPDDEWTRNRSRYKLYDFNPGEEERIEQAFFGRKGSVELPSNRRFFRREVKATDYTPEHDMMQAQLMKELQAKYGVEAVIREQDFVDVRVETPDVLIYYEIKTDLDPRAVMRQALGQILEYAYHPVRGGRRPDKLVIVGRAEMGPEDRVYLERLVVQFALPLEYQLVSI